MSNPTGIDAEINDDADGVDLYVNYEGLEGLRDNSTRPYSQFFANLITDIDEVQAKRQEPLNLDELATELGLMPGQEPLPGL